MSTFDGRVEGAIVGGLFVADLRTLPVAGSFDLINCLDDSLNYLVDPGDLVPALSGMAAHLARI